MASSEACRSLTATTRRRLHSLSVSTMAKAYIVPEWASEPKYDFSLEVMKEGVIIDNIDLSMIINRMKKVNRSYLILGRQPDIVDIQLDHQSISRQHAVLQYREDGALMLLDLHSVQGTFHNKIQLSPGVYQRLYVGDIIKFGASTRFYIVCGPETEQVEEYDSANMQAYRDNVAKREKELKEKHENEANSGISWGFADDAPEEEDESEDSEDEDYSGSNSKKSSKLPWYIRNDEHYERKYGDMYTADIEENEIGEKDRKLYEKIKKVEKKIQNMQTENKRIYLKENNQAGEFTEGQLAAVARNDMRIKELIEENDELIQQIRGKIALKQEKKVSIDKPAAKRRYEDDEDDLYDTTAQTMDRTLNWRLKKKQNSGQLVSSITFSSSTSNNNPLKLGVETVVTYEDLCAQQERNQQQLASIESRINTLSTEMIELHDAVAEDEMDIVLQQSKRADIDKELQKLRISKQEFELAARQTNKLIEIAKPALSNLASKKV
jgi:pSer/pThr/pTyr-binding forkhead associated (FHA) protein